MTKISEETGLSRPSLYKALSDEAKPQFANNNENFETIGGQIQVNPMPD
jgi:DNA-binding phage protein